MCTLKYIYENIFPVYKEPENFKERQDNTV